MIRLLILLISLSVVSTIDAASPIVIDGIPWSFNNIQEDIGVIGDIHADLPAFQLQLRTMRLIKGPKNKWSGGKKHLVLMGDLNDRGPDSFGVFEFVRQLESEALAAGGQVHSNLGNHELMILEGYTSYLSPDDLKNLESGPLREYFKQSTGERAKWLASRNTILKINRTIFIHAGLAEKTLAFAPPEQINTIVRQFIRHFQNPSLYLRPSSEFRWLLSSSMGQSPLWNRGLSSETLADQEKLNELRAEMSDISEIDDPFETDEVSTEGAVEAFISRYGREPDQTDIMDPEKLNQILNRLGADRIVISHTPTVSSNFRINLKHPLYGSKVIEVDTGLSGGYRGGRPSGLWIRGDKLEAVYPSDAAIAKVRAQCSDALKKMVNLKEE